MASWQQQGVYFVHIDRNTAGGEVHSGYENPKHTTLMNASGAVNTEEVLDARRCKGEAAGRWLRLRKVSLNMLCRVRTQPKPNQLKPLTLNTL